MSIPGGLGRGKRRGDAPTPLGSISRPPDAPGPAPRTCGRCSTSAVTQLAMELSDGTPVTFVSCQQCEHRSWFAEDGTELPIDEVLGRSKRQQ